ncbi:MAG TPA: M90 family metallopeptidase [Gemmatimonadales bacterium]|nr:M90 family metallopeptidase [Gemmatimonadales bacterium]
MGNIQILAAAAAVFALALVVGWGVVRTVSFRRGRRAPGVPTPSSWRELIAERVPLTARLTPDEWDRLLDWTGQFIRDKRFEGVGGLEITEAMKVFIAAQACLLILNLDAGCYPGVRVVLLYPGTFIPQPVALDHRLYTSPVPEPVPLLGQHVRGVVVLSWESVATGAVAANDGSNVVLHEFAHELDIENGDVDGVPLLEAPSSTREWARVLQRRFEELRVAAASETPTVLNVYGATNRAEFFAVATEAFFEKPEQLQAEYADLYAELRGFYRQDPAAGRSAPPPPVS